MFREHNFKISGLQTSVYSKTAAKGNGEIRGQCSLSLTEKQQFNYIFCGMSKFHFKSVKLDTSLVSDCMGNIEQYRNVLQALAANSSRILFRNFESISLKSFFSLLIQQRIRIINITNNLSNFELGSMNISVILRFKKIKKLSETYIRNSYWKVRNIFFINIHIYIHIYIYMQVSHI